MLGHRDNELNLEEHNDFFMDKISIINNNESFIIESGKEVNMF